jgi:hypothetical protein
MTMTPTALACPKCGADMRTYERSGIHVDQCAGCRGVFLDRGELERLIDAEAAYFARERQVSTPVAPAPAAVPDRTAGPAAGDYRRDRRGDDDWDDDRDDRRGNPNGQGRRGSFLGDVFDMFGG